MSNISDLNKKLKSMISIKYYLIMLVVLILVYLALANYEMVIVLFIITMFSIALKEKYKKYLLDGDDK